MASAASRARLKLAAALCAAAFGAACNFQNPPDIPMPPGQSPYDGCTPPASSCASGQALCCPGSLCIGGQCTVSNHCSGPDGNCSSSLDCCGTATCKGGKCDIGACSSSFAHCQASADCCGTLTCQSGLCK